MDETVECSCCEEEWLVDDVSLVCEYCVPIIRREMAREIVERLRENQDKGLTVSARALAGTIADWIEREYGLVETLEHDDS